MRLTCVYIIRARVSVFVLVRAHACIPMCNWSRNRRPTFILKRKGLGVLFVAAPCELLLIFFLGMGLRPLRAAVALWLCKKIWRRTSHPEGEGEPFMVKPSPVDSIVTHNVCNDTMIDRNSQFIVQLKHQE